MEQGKALRQLEGKFSVLGDRANVLSGKLEDLLFRAQRIAAAMKDDGKQKVKISDTMFGADLQIFRRDVRAFSQEAAGCASAVGSIEHGAVYDESSVMHAQAVMRMGDRLHKHVSSLLDKAVLAHQHIRAAEHKVEAWYMVQEIEALASMTQVLPGMSNKILVAVSSKKEGAHHAPAAPVVPSLPPPSSGGSAVPGSALQRRVPAPMRPVGRLLSSPQSPTDPKP